MGTEARPAGRADPSAARFHGEDGAEEWFLLPARRPRLRPLHECLRTKRAKELVRCARCNFLANLGLSKLVRDLSQAELGITVFLYCNCEMLFTLV